MTVPVHHADSVAALHAKFFEAARQTSDAFAQHAIGEALLVAIDDLLVRRMQHRSMQQMLDQNRILVCGLGDFDAPTCHFAPPDLLSFTPSGNVPPPIFGAA